MAEIKARVTKVFPLLADRRPRKSWGSNFSLDSGFALRLPKNYSISVFVDRRVFVAGYEKRLKYLNHDQIPVRMLSCIGEEWELHTEPTGEGQFGVVIYTRKGKALAAGSGNILETGTVRASFETLYKGMTNRAKITYECKTTIGPDGKPTVT